ncbi:hypothetical protein D3C74_352410 [compost metagenome]
MPQVDQYIIKNKLPDETQYNAAYQVWHKKSCPENILALDTFGEGVSKQKGQYIGEHHGEQHIFECKSEGTPKFRVRKNRSVVLEADQRMGNRNAVPARKG